MPYGLLREIPERGIETLGGNQLHAGHEHSCSQIDAVSPCQWSRRFSRRAMRL